MQIPKIKANTSFYGYKIKFLKPKKPQEYIPKNNIDKSKKGYEIFEMLQEMEEAKTFSANFSFLDENLEKTKNEAQNVILKDAIDDLKSAQNIANSVFKTFEDNKINKFAAIEQAQKSEGQSKEFEIEGGKYYSFAKDGKTTKTVFVKSKDNNVAIEFCAPLYAASNPNLFSIVSIEVPKFKLFFKSSLSEGTLCQLAKGISYDDNGAQYAQVFYNLNDDFLNPLLGVYQNAHFAPKDDYFCANDILDFSNHFQFKKTDFGLSKEAGQLAYFKNEKGEFKYDNKTGWVSPQGESLSAKEKIPSLEELGKMLKA